MTRVFVYEYCTASGLGRELSDPAHSLFREGKAMRDAVAEDFRAAGCEVVTLEVDEAGELAGFLRLGVEADVTLVIAPESGAVLYDRVGGLGDAGGVLLGSSLAAVEFTSYKPLLTHYWRQHGVPTPFTTPASEWPADRFPCVLKPADGAGSESTYRVDDVEAFAAALREATANRPGVRIIAQDFAPGTPASVAFLVGPDSRVVPLLPTFQLLSANGRFRYEGGELPIPGPLAERAVTLGRRAIDCLIPGLFGYVGVDLILGDAADGSGDVAIEINPRLTTSYVGLRTLADFNLAEMMLRVAAGKPVPEPRWKPGRVRFRPDGAVERLP